MYHHIVTFDSKLKHLYGTLSLPKEEKLAERFKTLEILLDSTFCLELIHALDLKHQQPASVEDEAVLIHPKVMLHLLCLLDCTNSIEYIARYLELRVDEVYELIRELHHTFSIDSLVSRIQYYYQQNKNHQNFPELKRRNEYLNVESTLEPKDLSEERKLRLRRRYGRLGTFLNIHGLC